MTINIELSNEQYKRGLQLCKAAGMPENYDSLVSILKVFCIRHIVQIESPAGSIEFWLSIPSINSNKKYDPLSAGFCIFPDAADGDIVDLVSIECNEEDRNITIKAFEDLESEDYTKEFSFSKEDFESIFSV